MSAASYAAAGCALAALTLSLLMSFDQLKHPRIVTLTISTAILWCFLKALGNIKIGIKRKLGKAIGNGRRLGLLERWYVADTRSGTHTGFAVALEIESEKGPPTSDEVRMLLKRVSSKFPWLRAHVKRDGVNGIDSRESLFKAKSPEQTVEPLWGDDLYVEVMSDGNDVPIRGVELSDSNDPNTFTRRLCGILEEEARKEWHDENPSLELWRAVLVRRENEHKSFGLVLAFHNVITDGIGSTAIVKSIMEESCVKDDKLCQRSNQELAPPMEDLLNTVPRVNHLLKPVLLDIFPGIASYLKPPHWRGMSHRPEVPPKERMCVMACISIGDEDLITRMRENGDCGGVTFEAACSVALCRAVSTHIRENSILYRSCPGIFREQHVRLNIQVVVDERGTCDPALQPSDLGCYITGPQVTMTINDKSNFHAAAREFHSKLKAAIPVARMDMGLCRFIREDWIPFAKKYSERDPNGVGDSIEIANIDCVMEKRRRLGGWNLKDLWFSQGRNRSGAAVTASMASGPGGLKAVLTSMPQAVSRSSLEDIGEKWRQELLNTFVGGNEN